MSAVGVVIILCKQRIITNIYAKIIQIAPISIRTHTKSIALLDVNRKAAAHGYSVKGVYVEFPDVGSERARIFGFRTCVQQCGCE
jgi:hypothetical protein